MLHNLEKKTADWIAANHLFDGSETVLLAVSGGADSTAMLHALATLKARGRVNARLLCAHINHQLRGSRSDADEAFVRQQARRVNLPVEIRQINVRRFASRHKLSVETAARQLRIDSLIDIASRHDCRCIATAHHIDDNAETLIQRLARGTGFTGLAGIRPVQPFYGQFRFVRPMLSCRRGQIINYLTSRNIAWCTDETNADCTFRRNYIRHRLLPRLQQNAASCLAEKLFTLSLSAQKLHTLICRRADEIQPRMTQLAAKQLSLNLRSFLDEPEPVKIELIRRSLAHIASHPPELSQHHYHQILNLARQKQTGKIIQLPHHFRVRQSYQTITFYTACRHTAVTAGTPLTTALNIPGETTCGDYHIFATIFDAGQADLEEFKVRKTSRVEWFDLDKLSLPLRLHPRRDGDRFVPLGLGSGKKIGKFLTAQKIPLPARRRLLLLADCKNIIWVYPIRASNLTRVTGQTRIILQLQINASPGSNN